MKRSARPTASLQASRSAAIRSAEAPGRQRIGAESFRSPLGKVRGGAHLAALLNRRLRFRNVSRENRADQGDATTVAGATSSILSGRLPILWLAIASSHVSGESDPTPRSPPAPSVPAAKVVKLSAFEVTTSRDRGYSSSHAIGATRTDTRLSDLPQAVTVINQQYIREWLPDNLLEAGKFVSGVTDAPTQMIRGLTGTSPAIDGLAAIGHYDLSLFERIEFLKGPSSIIYGDANKSGVISRSMKKPRFDQAYSMVDIDIGSWELFRATLDTTRPFGSNNQFSYRMIGMVSDRKGHKDSAYGRRRTLAPMLAWRIFPRTTVIVQISDHFDKSYKPWGNAFVLPPYNLGRASVLSNEVGIPRTFEPTEPYSYDKEQTRRYAFSVDHAFTEWWSARFTGTDAATLSTEYTAIPRDLINPRQMQRSWRNAFNAEKARAFSLDSLWLFTLGHTRHRFLVHARLGENESSSIQFLGRGPNGSTTNVLPLLDIYQPVYGGVPASIFLSSSTLSESRNLSLSFQEQAYLFDDRVVIQGGIRYAETGPNVGINRLTGTVNHGSRSSDWSNPKSVVGILYKATSGVSVYLSRSEIFTPNLGVQPDGTLFEPNISDSSEIGIKADLLANRFSALANAYRRRELNRIILHPDPTLASLGYRQQVHGDELTGAEVELHFSPVPELQLNLSFTHMSAHNRGGLYTRSLPRWQYGVVGRYEFSRGRFKNLALGLAHLAYDERPGDTGNSFFLDPYEVVDGFLSYRRGSYRFQLNIYNLFDAEDEYTSVNRNIVNLLPPRRFNFRISRQF